MHSKQRTKQGYIFDFKITLGNKMPSWNWSSLFLQGDIFNPNEPVVFEGIEVGTKAY